MADDNNTHDDEQRPGAQGAGDAADLPEDLRRLLDRAQADDEGTDVYVESDDDADDDEDDDELEEEFGQAGRGTDAGMTDEHGGDDKVLCVPSADQRASWRTEIDDVSEFHRLEIQHFFEVYKDLEPGKSVEGAHWVGRKAAEEEIRKSFKRAEETGYYKH